MYIIYDVWDNNTMLYMLIHNRIYLIFDILIYNTDKTKYTLYRMYIVCYSINDIVDNIWYLIYLISIIYIYII